MIYIHYIYCIVKNGYKTAGFGKVAHWVCLVYTGILCTYFIIRCTVYRVYAYFNFITHIHIPFHMHAPLILILIPLPLPPIQDGSDGEIWSEGFREEGWYEYQNRERAFMNSSTLPGKQGY